MTESQAQAKQNLSAATHKPDQTYEDYRERVKAKGVRPVNRQFWERVIRDAKFKMER